METEVKLAFKDKESLMSVIDEEWFADYCLDTTPKEPKKLRNIYYDTPDRELAKRGAVVRVRLYSSDEGEQYEHTVKFGGTVVNGLHQRYEWNVLTDSDEFDLTKFIKEASDNDDPVEILEEALEGIDASDLKPLCSTVFKRIVYMFGFGDSMMEVCFDWGKIIAGDKEEEICELELELESGDVVDLKDMAEFIVENTGAVTFDESKFRRCLKLLDEE